MNINMQLQSVETRGLRKQGSQVSSRTPSVVSLDPLSLDGIDPLSQFASEYVSIQSWKTDQRINELLIFFFKNSHLQRYQLQTKAMRSMMSPKIKSKVSGIYENHRYYQSIRRLRS